MPVPSPFPSTLTLTFSNNANLLIRSSVTGLPVQSPQYQLIFPPYENYSALQYSSFRVFGEVAVVFVLAVSGGLVVFNWYGKIYESLHLLQLLFLLSALEVRMPPNLWVFLQGFRNSHWYFWPNWFIDPHMQQPLNLAPPKILAIFYDSNFLRLCGHLLCLYLVALALLFFFYLCKHAANLARFYPTPHALFSSLHARARLFKWSHVHDLVTTSTMLVFFAFFAQTSDYLTESMEQSLAIVLSYVAGVMMVVYYWFMGRKLHRLVKLSQHDPVNFAHKAYLFRDNMMSITECATHPNELYLNYLRTARIVVFGALIGIFSTSPMYCTASIVVALAVSAFLYLFVRPYPDHLQNVLLAASDLSAAISTLMLSALHFMPDSDSRKWGVGWACIIGYIVSVFLLLLELAVSIVRGNSRPLKLGGEDGVEAGRGKIKEILTPSNLIVVPKHELQGWGQEEESAMGLNIHHS